MQSMLGGEKTSDSCGSGAGTHFEEREREGDTYANGVPPFFFSSSAFRHHLPLSLSVSLSLVCVRGIENDEERCTGGGGSLCRTFPQLRTREL